MTKQPTPFRAVHHTVWFRFLLGLATLIVWVACGSPTRDNGPGELREPKGPSESQETQESLVVRLVDASDLAAGRYQSVRFQVLGSKGSVFDTVSVTEVKPWMSVHGHGSAKPKWRPAEASRDDFSFDGGVKPGRDWVIEDLFFVMSGPWELEITVKWQESEPKTIIMPVEVR